MMCVPVRISGHWVSHTCSESTGVLGRGVRGPLFPVRVLLQWLLLAIVVACSAFVLGCVALVHWIGTDPRA